MKDKTSASLNICAVLFGCASIFMCSGCFLQTEPYRPVEYYDLSNPWQICPDGVDVNVLLFGMEASSKYKMIYRLDSNKILVDDYNKWAQPPGFMLTRYAQAAFSCGSATESVNDIKFTLQGVIFSFEIDLQKNQAHLGIKYTIKRSRDNKTLVEKSRTYSESFIVSKVASAEVFALAMSEASAKFVKNVKIEIECLKKEELKELKILKEKKLKEEAHSKKENLKLKKENSQEKAREMEEQKAKIHAAIVRAKAEKAQAELEKEKAEAELKKFRESIKKTEKAPKKQETNSGQLKKPLEKKAETKSK